jgi:hypothetical protein
MRGRIAFAALLATAAIWAGPVFGSADPGPFPIFIDRNGGTSPAERAELFAGRPGMLTASSPRPLLYLDWRLLHGLPVGPAAGTALTTPCCGEPASLGPHDGVYGWLEARAIVPGASESPYYIPTERSGPDYTSVPNCFRDAFDTAAATLRDRVRSYGKDSSAVRAWLQVQDSVFDACGSEGAALPPLPADAPSWLKADRAYQEAAFALYNRRNDEAATRFAAIARDPASPWRSKGQYLEVRALQREGARHPRCRSDRPVPGRPSQARRRPRRDLRPLGGPQDAPSPRLSRPVRRSARRSRQAIAQPAGG